MFTPRKDNLAINDQQQGFIESRSKRLTFLIGGNASGLTISAARKIADVVNKPATRPGSSIAVIGCGLSETIETMWKEKLLQFEFIDSNDINFVEWFDVKEQLPLRIILKTGWQIQFETWSFEQKSPWKCIDGFCFTGCQPPVPVIEKMLSRVVSPVEGGMFCEFTPQDTDDGRYLRLWIEKHGFDIYRLNITANIDDENSAVTQEWFDIWKSMLSPKEYETRLIGSWPQ